MTNTPLTFFQFCLFFSLVHGNTRIDPLFILEESPHLDRNDNSIDKHTTIIFDSNRFDKASLHDDIGEASSDIMC